MKKGLLNVLKGLASLSIGLGLFQFLSSNNVFSFLSGAMNYIPAVLSILLSFTAIYLYFKKERKFQVPVLVVLILAGAAASSMFGHKNAMNHMKKYEVPVD